MEEDMLNDPRPDLAGDSRLWHHLFRQIYKSDIPKLRALELHCMLYTVRSVGARLFVHVQQPLISPLGPPEGGWDQGDIRIMKSELIGYQAEVKKLIGMTRMAYYEEMKKTRGLEAANLWLSAQQTVTGRSGSYMKRA